MSPEPAYAYCKKVKLSVCTTPANGTFNIYVRHWWIVTPDDEILLYRGYSPQCNSNESVARGIRDRLYPDMDVRRLDQVFLPHHG